MKVRHGPTRVQKAHLVRLPLHLAERMFTRLAAGIARAAGWFREKAGITIHVGPSGDFTTITRGLYAARPGDEIWLAPGTYSAENGEVFPLTYPDHVNVIAPPSCTIATGPGTWDGEPWHEDEDWDYEEE